MRGEETTIHQGGKDSILKREPESKVLAQPADLERAKAVSHLFPY